MDQIIKQPQKNRSFAQLHQDMWACVLKYPFIFFILPALIYFPFDYFNEVVSSRLETDFWKQMRIYYRISGIVELFVGSYIFAIHIVTVKKMSNREKVTPGEVMSLAGRYYSNLLGCLLVAAKRIFLKVLLLIVPGIKKACQLAMAAPILIFDDLDVSDALSKSETCMQGQCLRYFKFGLLAFVIYIFGSLGLAVLLPEQKSPLQGALLCIPWNFLGALWSVGICLFYADITDRLDLARPVGRPDIQRTDSRDDRADVPSRKSLALAVFVSGALMITGAYSLWTAPYFEGESVVFGEYDNTIYYPPEMKYDAVHRIIEASRGAKLFEEEEEWIIRLQEKTQVYEYQLLVYKEYWDDEDLVEHFADLQSRLDKVGADRPVVLVLYDDDKEKMKRFAP
ncbi:MAG: hypothetical protein AB7S78_13545 [Candidatus Omnitrophota bacterium]